MILDKSLKVILSLPILKEETQSQRYQLLSAYCGLIKPPPGRIPLFILTSFPKLNLFEKTFLCTVHALQNKLDLHSFNIE